MDTVRVRSNVSRTKELMNRPSLADSGFLFGVILISTLPYLFQLGLYSDDWFYQATLAQASGHGMGAMVHGLLQDEGIRVRPVQLAYLVLSYKAFGLNPTPYHLLDSVVLGLATVFFYLALVELRMSRPFAFVVALLFGVSPHYSTDRIWISLQQAILSVVFAFIGTYLLLRSLRPEAEHPKKLIAVSVLSLIFSLLSYEVTLGLVIASLGLAGWHSHREIERTPRKPTAVPGGIAVVVAILFVVGIVKIHLQTKISYHHHFLGHLGALTAHAISQGFQFIFWTYCLKMPAVILHLYRDGALSGIAIVMSALIAVSTTIYLWGGIGQFEVPKPSTCLVLVLLGLMFFALGFGLFFPSIDWNFSTAGAANRVAIASAIGPSLVLPALMGLLCSIVKSPMLRFRAFSVLTGLVCGANCLVVSGIGFYWGEAASEQRAILTAVATSVRSPAEGTVILLDGFCRYLGPGIVFETDWDTTGALQLALGTSSVSGDVVSRNAHFGPAEVETSQYGSAERSYPYGNRLFVYNVRYKALKPLTLKGAAESYLREMNPTGDSGCPAASEGEGVKTF